MKIRNGFVSNSSSSSFIITNISTEQRNLMDFVVENSWLFEEYERTYYFNSGRYSLEQALKEVPHYNKIWSPGESKTIVFGDEQGTCIGAVYDYMLRDGGTSKSFSWEFDEALR